MCCWKSIVGQKRGVYDQGSSHFCARRVKSNPWISVIFHDFPCFSVISWFDKTTGFHQFWGGEQGYTTNFMELLLIKSSLSQMHLKLPCEPLWEETQNHSQTASFWKEVKNSVISWIILLGTLKPFKIPSIRKRRCNKKNGGPNRWGMCIRQGRDTNCQSYSLKRHISFFPHQK